MCNLFQSLISKFTKDIDETKCTYALVGSKQSIIIKEILDKSNISTKNEMLIMTYIYELEEKDKEIGRYKKRIKRYQDENLDLKLENSILEYNRDQAINYINKYEYQRYCPSPYEKEKYIMREESEGKDLLFILGGGANEISNAKDKR